MIIIKLEKLPVIPDIEGYDLEYLARQEDASNLIKVLEGGKRIEGPNVLEDVTKKMRRGDYKVMQLWSGEQPYIVVYMRVGGK